MAIATGSPPKQAVKEAQIIYGLRLVGGERHRLGSEGVAVEPLPAPAERQSSSFGEFLSQVVDAYRSGARQSDQVLRGHIDFGVRAGLVFAAQSATFAGLDDSGRLVSETWTYGGIPRSDITPITADRIVTLPLSAIWHLGDLLGPLPAGSGGRRSTAQATARA